MPQEKRKYIISLIIAAGIIAVVLILDMVTKAVTDGFDYVTVIPKFLIFHSTHNYSAAFGSNFGMDPGVFRVVVIVLTFLAIGAIGFFLVWVKKKHTLLNVALALILSGAAGNLIDRLAFGYVRDFIMIEYFGLTIFGSTNFAIFNIADSALICGVIVMMVWVIFFYSREGKNKATPMNPVLVTDGAPGMPEKKEFEPVNRPRPEKKKKDKDGDEPKPEDGEENGESEK